MGKQDHNPDRQGNQATVRPGLHDLSRIIQSTDEVSVSLRVLFLLLAPPGNPMHQVICNR